MSNESSTYPDPLDDPEVQENIARAKEHLRRIAKENDIDVDS